MSNAFAALKKNRNSQFEKLNEQMKSMGKPSDDDRLWKLTVDAADVGSAVIRFLPPPPNEDKPFVRIWDHGFQGPGGWYIENSLTTLGQDDPVSEYNTKLWNNGQQDEARKQKRRLNYYANIYVVKDPKNPQNEGKVFLFKFGKVIFDMINDAMFPKYEDIDPINPFDLWSGANFKLRSYSGDGGWRKYDKSEFDRSRMEVLAKPDGTLMTDEELEEVWNSQYSLQDIVDPKNFKSYDELKKKLYKVLALDAGNFEISSGGDAPSQAAKDDDKEMAYKPNFKEREASKQSEKPSPMDNSDEDLDEDFFKSLASDLDDEIPF